MGMLTFFVNSGKRAVKPIAPYVLFGGRSFRVQNALETIAFASGEKSTEAEEIFQRYDHNRCGMPHEQYLDRFVEMPEEISEEEIERQYRRLYGAAKRYGCTIFCDTPDTPFIWRVEKMGEEIAIIYVRV